MTDDLHVLQRMRCAELYRFQPRHQPYRQFHVAVLNSKMSANQFSLTNQNRTAVRFTCNSTFTNHCELLFFVIKWRNKRKKYIFSNILQAMTIRSNCRDLLIKVIQSLAKVTSINSQVNIHWKWKSKKRTIASLIHIAVKLENCADLLCQLYRHHSQYLPIAKLANKWNHAKLH